MRARGEFEYVGRKFLGNNHAGDALTAVPVREFRGALDRSFSEGRFDVGVNFLLAGGYTGQTVESVALRANWGAVLANRWRSLEIVRQCIVCLPFWTILPVHQLGGWLVAKPPRIKGWVEAF